MRLTPEKRKLLEKALENDKILRMEDAFKIYSSKESAKMAVKSLEANGMLEKKEVGRFKLTDIPEDMQSATEQNYGPKDFLGIILKRVMQRINKD